MAVQMEWWMVTNRETERDGLLLLGMHHTFIFSLYLFMIYPFLPLPWTDWWCYGGVKVKHTWLFSHCMYCWGCTAEQSTGTVGGCLLKVAVGIFIRVTRGAVKLCLTTLWPCSRVCSSSTVPVQKPQTPGYVCTCTLQEQGTTLCLCCVWLTPTHDAVQRPLVYCFSEDWLEPIISFVRVN